MGEPAKEYGTFLVDENATTPANKNEQRPDNSGSYDKI